MRPSGAQLHMLTLKSNRPAAIPKRHCQESAAAQLSCSDCADAHLLLLRWELVSIDEERAGLGVPVDRRAVSDGSGLRLQQRARHLRRRHCDNSADEGACSCHPNHTQSSWKLHNWRQSRCCSPASVETHLHVERCLLITRRKGSDATSLFHGVWHLRQCHTKTCVMASSMRKRVSTRLLPNRGSLHKRCEGPLPSEFRLFVASRKPVISCPAPAASELTAVLIENTSQLD